MKEQAAPGWTHCSSLHTAELTPVLITSCLPRGLRVFLVLAALVRPVVAVWQVHYHLPLPEGVLTPLGSPVEDVGGTDVAAVTGELRTGFVASRIVRVISTVLVVFIVHL